MKNRLYYPYPVVVLLFLFVTFGCTRTTSPTPDEAMRKSVPPVLIDDLPLDSFVLALSRQIQLLESGHGPEKYQFGKKEFRREEYLPKLRALLTTAKSARSFPELFPYFQRNFAFHEVYGSKHWGEVLVTGYYESEIAGSRRPTREYPQPLYRRPPELVEGKVYLTRKEIDSGLALRGRGLELCYVDPLDATVIQTQGSGVVALEDGSSLQLVFAGKNNRPFTSIGKYVKEKLQVEHAYFDTVEDYLRRLSIGELRSILNLNESYVFFEPNNFGARTSMGIPATPGRTVAIDPKLFPKGGIGFLAFERPGSEVGTSERVGRFVIAQDVGTAIKGPARVDLFVGNGASAKFEAGRLKSQGKFYFLVPK